MDRPTLTSATARDIILEIVRNMREGLEPLHYSTLPPAIFHVYLHPEDMDRLRGIVPRIIDEAKRALDAELASLNRGGLAERFKLSRRAEPKVEVPEGGWQVRILENTDDEVDRGDIVIYSELALPVRTEFSDGNMTKRIATRKMGGVEAAPQTSYQPAAPAPPAEPVNDGALATLEYEDDGGKRVYRMTKDQIVVGRGGRDYWTDLKLNTLPDVSREHFRLRRDAESGKFFLKDLSRLGTTINGEAAPSSVEFVEGEKRDRNVEAPVPDEARIGLAGVIFLEFRTIAHG